MPVQLMLALMGPVLPAADPGAPQALFSATSSPQSAHAPSPLDYYPDRACVWVSLVGLP